GSTATDSFGDDDDVIFGDLGNITQDVSGWRDTTKPIPSLPQRLQTTLRSRMIVSQSRQTGADDYIYGNGGDDVLIGGSGSDAIDGGTERDLIFGDNVSLDRTTHLNNFTSKRFEVLTGTQIYSTATATAGNDQANNVPQLDPRGHGTWGDYVITLLDHLDTPFADSFGNDYIAGGGSGVGRSAFTADDMIFGELGDDTAQGDGSIDYVAHVLNQTAGLLDFATLGGRVGVLQVAANYAGNPFRDVTNALVLRPSFDSPATDGHDYVEGNGGNDLLFGNQGQDDLIGGSSEFFGLTSKALRPDGSVNGNVSGSDLIFGGSGTMIVRNNPGDATVDPVTGVITTTPSGHANDSDMILGDNGDIIRIVGINGVVTSPPAYQTFNYDNYGTTKIVVRAGRLIDYTPGGLDFNPAAAATDIGAADEIHGESGDDFVYAQKGSDYIFGEGQDDDLLGGYGNDWISGGTGQDGVLGDDGRIFTSRNSSTIAEPLNGIAALLASDPDTSFSNGNVLNEFIYTPGHIQIATINVAGELKKTVDLTPFSVDPGWDANTDEFGGLLIANHRSDDVIFGGLGSDFLHAGSGDDAMSGAEALTLSFAQNATGTGVVQTDYLHPFNPGNFLRFNPIDPQGTHPPNLVGRTGEFALYDEFDPLRKVSLNDNGTLNKTNTGKEFFLNFNQTEGVLRPEGDTAGPQSFHYAAVHDDGDDAIFGDNGNDWIVGGTGRDNTFGGWGNDLLNVDDDQSTNGSLNDVPDTHPTYEDRAYGGAGKDVLIGNTGGDRLIDWVGEFNSYLVPFAPFGMATVSRTVQPQLPEFLYALSRQDGADRTRAADFGTDPVRNGERAGELGLVLQSDHGVWQTQTGAPTDPQAGNIPGGQRDVLRSASFSAGQNTGFFAETGTWSTGGGAIQNTLATGDSVNLFDLDMWLPSYYELLGTVQLNDAGSRNGFLIFDYQSPTDFKYAGLDALASLMRIGQRTAAGWIDKATLAPTSTISANQTNQLTLTVNGTTATLKRGTKSVSYTFSDPLNDGMLGIGAYNSTVTLGGFTVQTIPHVFTYQVTEDFSDGVADNFTPQTGTWTTTSGSSGRYTGTPTAPNPAISARPFVVAPLSYVEYSADVRANAAGTSAGLVFAYTDANNFLYAAVVAGTNQVVLGHRSNGNWFVDAVASKNINAGTDYTLLVALDKLNVNVVVNGSSILNFNYNFSVVGGSIGLLAQTGSASFDNLLIKGDDQAFAGGGAPQLAVTPATRDEAAAITGEQLAPIVAAAIDRWADTPGLATDAKALREAAVVIADLPELMIGQTIGNSIVIDPTAAGYGWFVDVTPWDDSEFADPKANGMLEAPNASAAVGRMDLLTVVMHELGHLLGKDDIVAEVNPVDLMNATLAAGVRRLPDGLATPESAVGLVVPVADEGTEPLPKRSAENASELLEATSGPASERMDPVTVVKNADEVKSTDLTNATLGDEVTSSGKVDGAASLVATPEPTVELVGPVADEATEPLPKNGGSLPGWQVDVGLATAALLTSTAEPQHDSLSGLVLTLPLDGQVGTELVWLWQKAAPLALPSTLFANPVPFAGMANGPDESWLPRTEHAEESSAAFWGELLSGESDFQDGFSPLFSEYDELSAKVARLLQGKN
ncbi:MAG TPA: hypothetical protein VEL76_41190, partial [Gemmataceae bacterium]|nr:hypothetical protein [Gemmataceae bacterium]